MLTITPNDGLEKYLCDRAFATATPVSGSFELLPICNMDCRMCYIRMSPRQMQAEGTPLTAGQWLRIGEEAAEQGTMFVLLTGGEPLLHKEFCEIYKGLKQLGICITINTNGTLISDPVVRTLADSMPRRVNVSLYGPNDEVYAALCRNPKGYTQTICGIKKLQEAGIPVKINYTLTAYNRMEWDEMSQLSDELGIPVSTPTYLFPPARKPNGHTEGQGRMSPQEAAGMQVEILQKLTASDTGYKKEVLRILEDIKCRQQEDNAEITVPGGFLCTAGVSSFWVNWKGELTPCGMMKQPLSDLCRCSFSAGWEYIKEEPKKIFTSNKCFHCKYRKICQNCAASSMAETGHTDQEPHYHCEMCQAYEHLLKESIDENK